MNAPLDPHDEGSDWGAPPPTDSTRPANPSPRANAVGRAATGAASSAANAPGDVVSDTTEASASAQPAAAAAGKKSDDESSGGRRRSSMIVAAAVMGSRVMGLVREVVFAAMFGASAVWDAYLAAFQIPNLLRDLFAEGALSTAFTTIFTRVWEKEGEARAWDLARLVVTGMLMVLGLICLLGIAGSYWIVMATSPGFREVPGKFELTVHLTQVMFPFIIFVSIAAVVMGMLNSRHIYGLPASASTVFNIVSIIGSVILAYLIDWPADWLHPHFGHRSITEERAIYGVCLGVLLGGVAQLGVQLPALWKLGFRFAFRINWQDPYLRAILVLMVPSVIAGAAVQVNVLVNANFASHIDHARSWLSYAFRLMQFPIGVFGVAIATVTLPAVARQQAKKNLVAFGNTVREALRFAFYLTLPASVGLAVMAEPLIRVLYQRGAFTTNDTHQAAMTLQAYVIGLAGYAGIKVLVPCFYALDQPKTPVYVSLFGIVLNFAFNYTAVMVFNLAQVGLAMTTGLVALINFLQLIYFLSRRVNVGDPAEWLQFFLRVSAATFLCGMVALGLERLTHPATQSLIVAILGVTLCIGAAGAVYFIASVWLRLPEAVELAEFVARKAKIRLPASLRKSGPGR